jgi:uncharacterized HAD superfamily protein
LKQINLKIGIDLDNTIIDYSNSLKKLLQEEYKIELKNETIHKSLIKKHIIEKYSDREWTKAQGLLYSKYLDYANPYPGCLDALKKLSIKGSELYIISHKTRYPFIGGKTNLILLAKKWINTNLVHENGVNLFEEANILFNESIHEKVESIISHDLDIFIDDKVPSEFETENFLKSVQSLLAPNALIMFNRMAQNDIALKKTADYSNQVFKSIFSHSKILELRGNRMLIGINVSKN